MITVHKNKPNVCVKSTIQKLHEKVDCHYLLCTYDCFFYYVGGTVDNSDVIGIGNKHK